MNVTSESKADAVREMFNGIAHRYDFLNHFLSLGIDTIWRKRAVACFDDLVGKSVFDIACGTCDLAIQIAESDSTVKVSAEDFSPEMVIRGQEKVTALNLQGRITVKAGDALNISHPDEIFDGVTCAFGVRNFAELETGLKEMSRVLKPAGRMVILEFTTPENRVIAAIYKFYFTRALPFMGGLISGKPQAYSYLPESVYAFPRPEKFISILENSGLSHIKFTPLTFGICGIYTGVKK